MKTKIFEITDGRKTWWSAEGYPLENNISVWEWDTEIPEYLNPYETKYETIAIEPDGIPQKIEIINGKNDKPKLVYDSKNYEKKYIQLKIENRKEVDNAMYL